ncbi:plasmid pRiA4b ORF-3 family protein [Streptomyces sp. NPDC059340]|uniref:plasmid pRiA4b ORF-3 family protein n=1 Tax=Streptomyces sp. NPDC059340 TaxID=3346806 RepID=UPI0036A1030D
MVTAAGATTSEQLVIGRHDRLRYSYDFGDDREHDILVEAVTTAEPGITYPRCLTGRRACPPEDCGDV